MIVFVPKVMNVVGDI